MSEEGRKGVLVVDDEADVRAYVSLALEDAGFEVATAADGLGALEMVRRNPPDLISLDLSHASPLRRPLLPRSPER